jgi:hypothetical protein
MKNSSKLKALAIQPLNSLNLRTVIPTKVVSHPTKPVAAPAQTFAEIMFDLDDVPNSYNDVTEDLEIDSDYFNRLSSLLTPDTPIGAAVSYLFLF